MSQILPYLYLGDSCFGLDEKELDEKKIKSVVNISGHTTKEIQSKFENYLFISIKDHPTENIKLYFEETSNFIENHKNEGRVLVHCGEGVSRAPTIVLCYLMKYKKLTLEESYWYTRFKRMQINPNNGFFRHLLTFEKELFGKNSIKTNIFEDDWGFGCYELKPIDVKNILN
eukprot:gene1048-10567_t